MYKNSFRRIMSLITAMFIVGGLFGQLCSPTAFAEESETKRDAIIVSMGDSFSSGEGIPSFYGSELPVAYKVRNLDWLAHRSPGAWSGMLTLPELEGNMANYKWGGSASESYEDSFSGLEYTSAYLTQSYDPHWYFVASSGATTDNISGTQEKTYKQLEGIQYNDTIDLPAQIEVFDALEKEGKKADYVTITIGGNDADFTGIITQTILYPDHLNVNQLSDKINKTWRDFYKPGGIKDKIINTYTEIAEKAGKQAHIIVAGYPKLISEGVGISENEAEIVNNAVHDFNQAIEQTVKQCESGSKMSLQEFFNTVRKSGLKMALSELMDMFRMYKHGEVNPINISFASVEEAFEGHEANTEEPFFNELLIPSQPEDIAMSPVSAYSFHPNEKGALVYAACVQDEIDRLEGVSSESRSVYETYQNAFQLTTASGCWSEELSITADMQMTNDSQTMKGTLYMSSDLDVSGYDKDDLSNLCISGSVSIGMAGMEYAWDVDYEDGVAQYNWTEPQVQTTTASIQPSFFEYQQLTENMITDASIDGQTLSFIIPANKLNYAFLNSGFSDLNLLADITYGDVDVTVNLNPDSGEIDNMIMTFHATMEISGYEAEADYITEYSFIKRDSIQEDEVDEEDVVEGEWITEEKAIELASDYWDVEAGETDNETGFLLSIMVMEYPTEKNPTYKTALRAHVEGHVTTYDIILIDAVTGECTSFW